MTDHDHLHRYAESGDAAAFEALVEKYLGVVRSTALRRSQCRQLAEEATQNTFTILARKASRLRRHPTIAGWLQRTARYEAGRLRRKEDQQTKVMNRMAEEAPTEPAAESPEVDREALDRELARLAPKDRDVLMLRFFEGLSFAEIGERIGKSAGTAQKRTERSLAKLRRGASLSSVAAVGAALQSQFPAQAGAASVAQLTSLAVSASAALSATTLITNTVVTMSYLKPIAVAAVLLVFAWPISAELIERRSLQTEIAAARSAPAEAGLATSATNTQGSPPGAAAASNGPLTAIAKSSKPVAEAEITPQEVGRMLGEFKAQDYRFKQRYPEGMPAKDDPRFTEYLAEMDQMGRRLSKLITNPRMMAGFESDDDDEMMPMISTMIATSIGLDAANSAELTSILLAAEEQRTLRKLRTEDHSEDPEAWNLRMEELSAEVLGSIGESIGEREAEQILAIHGRGFLHSINLGLSTGSPASSSPPATPTQP